MKKKLLTFLPYLLILLASIASNYILFYQGFTFGDDYSFHIANIYEIYKLLKEGKGVSVISGYLSSGLGTATRLFYAPLTHSYYGYGIYLLSFLRLDFITSFKVLYFISNLLSGYFMYSFAKKYCTGNRLAATLMAIAYLLAPYRYFDQYCRWAIAESFAFTFLPLFFGGIWEICNQKDEIKVGPYLKVIIGGALMLFAHNITALYAAIFGVLLILFYCKNVILSFKKPRFIIYTSVSVLLLAGIVSGYIYSVISLENSGLYNISNPSMIWADVEKVIRGVGFETIWDRSGFLNFDWLIGNFSAENTLYSLTLSLVLFVIGFIDFIFIFYLTDSKKINTPFRLLIASIFFYGIISIIGRRTETYLAATIFILLFSLIESMFHFSQRNAFEEVDHFYSKPSFYWALTVLGICLFLMLSEKVWEYLPQTLLNIQFPWRLWAFVEVSICFLVGDIAKLLKPTKAGQLILTGLICTMLASNQALYEKQLSYEKESDQKAYVIDDSMLSSSAADGWNNEYLPQLFYTNYHSQYQNSLYPYVKRVIVDKDFDTPAYQVSPVILDGKGSIQVDSCFASDWVMNISVGSEEALFQLPLIYYPGYQVSYESEGKQTKVEVENVDALVSFSLKEGDYKVNLSYVGTSTRRALDYAGYACWGLTAGFAVYGFIHQAKRKKE